MNKFILFLSIVLVSCGKENLSNKNYYGDLSKEAFYDESIVEKTESKDSKDFSLDKGSKIIKQGRLEFEVSHLKKTKIDIDTLIKKYAAYYESEHYSAHENRINYTLDIRVPNENFDALISGLESGSAKLINKNISMSDVTEEYVDLKIRLDNNLAYLAQYKEVLKKAESIKDILDVQEKIRRIEEEIESKKGRIKYLDGKVKFSTINLVLFETTNVQYAGVPPFGLKLKNAFKNGIKIFLGFIVTLVNFWPFVIVCFVFWFLRKRLFTVFKRKPKTAN